MKVTLETQPLEFLKRQAPDTRRRLREALRSVEAEALFPEALQDSLDGFYKLRVDRFRFILQHVSGEAGPFFRVVFCEQRKIVYEVFSQLLGLE